MKESESPRWLLVTDVDDTLDGDSTAIASFALECGDLDIVLNSSRPRSSVIETISHFPLGLVIAGLVTGLGTEILLQGADRIEWSSRFQGWDRRLIDDLMVEEGVAPHPPAWQTRFKASFSVRHTRFEELKAKVLERSPDSTIIFSGTSDFDVIPSGAGKGSAALWVAEFLGIPHDRMIVAGDSGNDLEMLKVAEKAIVVGNARRELVARADPSRTYFARAFHASGLLEGLRHWGAIDQNPRIQ